MAAKAKMSALCGKCGEFEVVRVRKPRKSSSGETYDLPRQVVCPKCRMWAMVMTVEDVA